MTNSKLSTIIIPVQIHKTQLNQLLKRDFKPIDMPGNQRIEDIEVHGEGQEMNIVLQMTGRLSGKVQANFIPQFDLANQKIKITQLSTQLLNDGFLSKGLNWMMDSFFKDNLQEKVQEIIDEQLGKLYGNYVKKNQLIPLQNGLSVDVLVEKIDVRDYKFSQSILHLELEIQGFLRLFSRPVST